jgi:putative FmdB family regulatory protein
MPIYVYRCSKCEEAVEEIQKYDDPPPVRDCPQGGTCAFERQMTSASRFKFVGEGWGGNELQSDGQTIMRKIKGKNTTKYGEGSV